jgi:hypothetical protein
VAEDSTGDRADDDALVLFGRGRAASAKQKHRKGCNSTFE